MPGYVPGPDTVAVDLLDSFLPSDVQTAEASVQSPVVGGSTMTTSPFPLGSMVISHHWLLPWVTRRALVTWPFSTSRTWWFTSTLLSDGDSLKWTCRVNVVDAPEWPFSGNPSLGVRGSHACGGDSLGGM